MVKKLLIAAVVVIALGVLYTGSSYYIGYRSEHQLMSMMNTAQATANNELAWEQVQIERGLFSSTGSMVLVLNQLKPDGQAAAQVRIQYRIDHQLDWNRLAQFAWSMTPHQAVAKGLEPLYPQTPSLTGEGRLDWSGIARTTIAFPGVERAMVQTGLLTVAPLLGNLTVGDNVFELKMGIAEIDFADPVNAEHVQLKNLGYEARSDDVSGGSVGVTFSLGQALFKRAEGISDTLTDYRWHFDATYTNDRLNIDTQNTIASMNVMGHQVNDLQISLGVDGLHRTDLQALADLLGEIGPDWLGLSDEQIQRAERLGLSLLTRGIEVRVPAIKANFKLSGVDAAQTLRIEDVSFLARDLNPALGIGQIRMAVGAFQGPEILGADLPLIEGLQFELTNTLVDGQADLYLNQSLGRFSQAEQRLRDVAIQARLKGLPQEGLLAIIALMRESDGDLSLWSSEQQAMLTAILKEGARNGLLFEVSRFQGTFDRRDGPPDALALEGLVFEAKLDDAATGAGKASFALGRLAASGPQLLGVPNITDYKLTAINDVVNGLIDYRLDKSIQAFDSPWVKLGPSALSFRLSGLSAIDLQRLAELSPAFEAGLDDAQTAEVTQIVRRALASGFKLSVPKLQLLIDDAQIEGHGDVSLTGLGRAPLSSFDVARLGQLQATLALAGKSPWLEPLVQQGLMMGLLVSDASNGSSVSRGQGVTGQYQYEGGQLRLNGMPVPTAEFTLAANLMVQQLLAQSEQTPVPVIAPRQRRGPSQ